MKEWIEKYLRKGSIERKLMLTTGGFSLVILVLMYFFVTVRDEGIQFAAKEASGTRVLGSLSTLMTEAAKGGSSIFQMDNALVNASLSELQKQEEAIDKLGIKDKVSALQAAASAAASNATPVKCADLQRATRDIIATVADNSNLTLDPDLDSYYLMDACCIRTADLANLQAKLLKDLEYCGTNGGPEALTRLTVTCARIEDVCATLETDVQTSMTKNSSGDVRKSLEGSLTRLLKTARYLSDLETIGTSSGAAAQAVIDSHRSAILDAYSANSAFTTQALQQLHSLLEARQDGFSSERLRNISIALLLMLLPLVLSVLVARYIVKGIRELRTAVSAVQSGDLDTVVNVVSEDDLGQLGSGFNAMVQTIKESNAQNMQERETARRFAEEAQDLKKQSDEYSEYLRNSISVVLGGMQRFSTGDLTVQIPAEGEDLIAELCTGFNSSVINLRNVVENVRNAVDATASASSEISSSTEQMAAGSHEQTMQTADVASAVEEMTKTIIENSTNARETAENAETARRAADQGVIVIRDTVQGMKRIADVVHNCAQMVKALGDSSSQIGEIITVINDIADQTNLLALNAAIEAARAGEQGRGFAVVADEVRKLAERTTKATKEISGMISRIQNETSTAIDSMESGTEEVDQGIKLTDQAGQAFTGISESVKNVSSMISQIAVACEQQSGASETISRSIQAISEVTSQTATGTEQIAHAADDLNRLTENLHQIVSHFRLHDEGGSMTGGPRPHYAEDKHIVESSQRSSYSRSSVS